MTFNAYDYEHVHRSLGINVSKLGCVMLDVERIKVTDYVDDYADDLYYAQNPERKWIRGAVAEESAHLTLLYGLMENAWNWQHEINSVLEDWTLPLVEVEKVDYFPSTFADEPYACIIAKIKKTPKLIEGHQRLSLLPHINTFPEYSPHVTLAYVKEDVKIRRKWVRELDYWLGGKNLAVLGKNLGYRP
jgi:2'-5' RNA ligase